ncbi:MAG: histone deacetylase family protein [Pseudomonadota bacterium]
MSLALITHLDCMLHQMGDHHPESPARLKSILDAINEDVQLKKINHYTAPKADLADLQLVHPRSYIEHIFSKIPKSHHGDDLVMLDGDTSVCFKSADAALRASGGLNKACDLVCKGQYNHAMALVRPPGHHAEPNRSMGFCLFNSIAIAGFYLQKKYQIKRICILDFDVHHGNGTQEALWDKEQFLFISSHQMPLYPGSGYQHERGVYHNILNVPLNSNSDGRLMRQQYEKIVFPQIDAFKPDFILVSAGFDAHVDDPLAQLEWEDDDFYWLGARLKEMANIHCDGKLVATLEGGYHLKALGRSVKCFLAALNERSS